MKSNDGENMRPKTKSGGAPSAVRKVEGPNLNGVSNKGGRVGVNREISRIISSAEIRIALRLNALFV